jgi:Icc-related predicted phosphoesterase
VKFLVVSDCEAGLPTLPTGAADLVVCCGDVPRDVLERVVTRYSVPCLGVLGNHDPALAPALLRQLHLTVAEVASVTFGGFEGSWRYKPRGHHLYEERDVGALLRGFPRVDVFVAHNPPAGVHDAPDDVHNGFAAFRRYIEEEQPALFLHGHVHRSAETMVGRTRVVAVLGARMVEYGEGA